MYLPLAAAAAFAVLGGCALWRSLLPRPAATGPSAAYAHWATPLAVWGVVFTSLGYGTLLRNRDYRSSLAIWLDAVHKYPRNPSAHSNLGDALDDLGKTAEAIAEYRAAVRVEPAYAVGHNNLGVALAHTGDPAKAIEEFRAALRLNPAYVDAHHNLGLVLSALGESAAAVEQYREALRLNPRRVDTHYRLAMVLESMADPTDLPLPHYQEALRLAESAGQTEFAHELQARLTRYRASHPAPSRPSPNDSPLPPAGEGPGVRARGGGTR
jgi:tetratricopeptide (TPR) repeat protein